MNFKKVNSQIYFLCLFFLISTFYFLYQYYVNFSWDFQTYFMNADYLFSDGHYFELFRPPVMSVIIFLLSFFDFIIDVKVLFVIFSSLLFLFSSIFLARVLNMNIVLFYGLSLSAYTLGYGSYNGTELLSLSFLQLALVLLLRENVLSGFFLALSALSRYTGLIFFPFLLLHKKFKNIFLSFLIFGLSFVPWLIFNYYFAGNFLGSIADQFANNVIFRSYFTQNPDYLDFVQVFGYLFLFFIVGIFSEYRKITLDLFENLNIRNSLVFLQKYRIDVIMFFLTIYTIYTYLSLPLKDARYMFSLVLPLTYYSYFGILRFIDFFELYFLKRRKNLMFIALFFVLLNFFSLFFLENSGEIYYSNSDNYEKIKSGLVELGMGECIIMSDSWVYLNSLGLYSVPLFSKEVLFKNIENNYKFVKINHLDVPESIYDVNFDTDLNLLKKDSYYSVYGNNNTCENETFVYDVYFSQEVKQRIQTKSGVEININPCFVMFHNLSLLEKTCNFINFNGFELDENRVLD